MPPAKEEQVDKPSTPVPPPPQLPFLFHVRSSDAFIIATVALGLFTDMAVYSILMPFLPFLLDSLQSGDPLSQMPDPYSVEENSLQISRYSGILLSVYAVGLLGTAPFFGFLGDRMKTRRIPNLLGIQGLIMSTFLFTFGKTFWILLVARFLQGVSGACMWVIGLTLIADTFPPETLGVQMSKVLVSYTFGLFVGPPIGGALYFHFGPQPPFFLCIALACLDFILRFMLIEKRNLSPELLKHVRGNTKPNVSETTIAEKPPGEEKADPDVETSKDIENTFVGTSDRVDLEKNTPPSSVIGTPTITESSEPSSPPKKVSTIKLLMHPRMLTSLLLVLLNALLYSSFESTLPLHLASEFDLNSSQIGTIAMAQILPNFFVAPLSGYITDKFGPKFICAVCLIMTGAMTMLLGVPNHSTGLWPFIVILSINGATGMMFLTPVLTDIAFVVNEQDGEKGDGFARSYALFNMGFGCGMIAGPIFGGFLYSAIGFFYVNILLGVILLLALPFPCLYTGGKGKLFQWRRRALTSA